MNWCGHLVPSINIYEFFTLSQRCPKHLRGHNLWGQICYNWGFPLEPNWIYLIYDFWTKGKHFPSLSLRVHFPFINTRKGDYYRYLAEFKTVNERKEATDQSLKAYQVCQTWKYFNFHWSLFFWWMFLISSSENWNILTKTDVICNAGCYQHCYDRSSTHASD